MLNLETLRGDYSNAGRRFVVDQDWKSYTPEEHARWRDLFKRQILLAKEHASKPVIEALKVMDCADAIPRLEKVSDALDQATGWELVAVPGLIPDDVFFEHLAARRFPVTRWLREASEMDYIVEPDIFHDFFGHVPMLFHPTFAEAMQKYGRQGMSLSGGGAERLARLYWYVVEFGLEMTNDGLKAFGAGILSSPAETRFAVLDPTPNRVGFDLKRVLRTRYRIDDFQETYFVLDDVMDLLTAVDQPLEPVIESLRGLRDIDPMELIDGDRIFCGGHGRRSFAGSRSTQ